LKKKGGLVAGEADKKVQKMICE